ncbi:MAG: fused MFS/spermidine synthase, partial [Alphaproteobacteria bacterium]|nr:fused MFS/spermidine synthase [Alphaproteobacteria bacterium]
MTREGAAAHDAADRGGEYRPAIGDEPAAQRARLTLRVYVAAIFLSAALLFAVQPMFARMVLPLLGGTPAVWSVAMAFFQAALLAGYLYAHLLTSLLPARLGSLAHIAVMLAAATALPLAVATGWLPPPSDGAALWLLGLFAASIGLPFFALSANGPLLQAWFVRTGHAAGRDPYFLYAASNVGSFAALLAYPLVIEPFLPLGLQSAAWTIGFHVLVALLAACAWFVRPRAAPGAARVVADDPGTAAPRTGEIGAWVGLAAVPSGLLVAVTAHVSTDVAAAPLLWVVPLALYLATFVLAFQPQDGIRHRATLFLQPLAIAAVAAAIGMGTRLHLGFAVAAHLLGFFVVALAWHGELARRRPAPRHLTLFYVALSAGGMVGGMFCGLAAPHLFSWIAEYPLLLVAAALFRPGLALPRGRASRGAHAAALALAVALLLPGFLGRSDLVTGLIAQLGADSYDVQRAAAWAIPAAALLLARQPLRFAGAIALGLLLLRAYPLDGGREATGRSFFGVHKVSETADGRFRVLHHGTTVHGAQRIRDDEGRPIEAERPEPLTYYHRGSPMARVLAAARESAGGPLRVAVIGLGTGSLACYARPGDVWRFFEIDPAIVRVARDPARFSFLSSCAPDVPIVLGDARLTLAALPDASFDVIVVDAFSSDAIPVHLMTREAMAIYRAKAVPGGLVALHVSNR